LASPRRCRAPGAVVPELRAVPAHGVAGLFASAACRPPPARYSRQHRRLASLQDSSGKGGCVMGFKQTPEHRFGKGSYHQIGLVRGQFGNVPEADWLKFIADTGFDGWEEASWELDLRRCDTDEGAAAYARERVDLARKHGLEIF